MKVQGGAWNLFVRLKNYIKTRPRDRPEFVVGLLDAGQKRFNEISTAWRKGKEARINASFIGFDE
jgi:hypothetical protein